MNYVKKMCILRQIKQGFSADGKTLSGLIKAEQYGKNLAVEVSIINFAPLSSGEYYCLLSDGKGKTEMLALRGKSFFNILTDMDISGGFCGIICHIKNTVTPVAYGVNGNGKYDWKNILNSTLPPVFPKMEQDLQPQNEGAQTIAVTQENAKTNDYNDELLANENYYAEENDERKQSEKIKQNAHIEGATEKQNEKEGADATQNVDATRVLHPFQKHPDGYYLSVKAEIDELFEKYPRDTTLCGAFSCCDWVRVKGDKDNPQYLVGVLYEDGRVRYICYALATQDKDNPPAEIKKVCAFVPRSVFDSTQGFFVIFQSASSGECIKPSLA